jgi:hypothetical protein
MLRLARRLLGSLLSPPAWRARLAAWQGARFDAAYGTDTARHVPVADLVRVPGDLRQHAVHYEPSALPKIRRALGVVRRHLGPAISSYSFVDVGSGKGLVVLLASREPYRHVHGVELAPDLHAIARTNHEKFLARHRAATPVTWWCMNALDFPMPEGNLVVYLYNPFDELLTAHLVDRLAAADGRRHLVIVYINPVHRHVFERESRWGALFDDGTMCVYTSRRDASPGGDTRPSATGAR